MLTETLSRDSRFGGNLSQDVSKADPDYSPKLAFLGAQAPHTLWHIRTQTRAQSETENQGVFEHGPVCAD